MNAIKRCSSGITAIILTRNEESNLPACIKSIDGVVDRIVVVDSFSSDETVNVALDLGAEVIQHEFINYGAQFQFALDNASIDTQWVLRIDADERMTADSSSEMVSLCELNKDTDVNGIVMRLKIHFMGKELRHGGAYPMRKLCIFKYAEAFMETRYMDEQIVLKRGKCIEMKHDVEHDDYKDLSFWIGKHNWYATRAAKDYLENLSQDDDSADKLDANSKINRLVKQRVYYKLPSRIRTWLYFAYRYYFRLGFLDGRAGYWYAFFQAYWYRTLVDAKIYESLHCGAAIGETGSLK